MIGSALVTNTDETYPMSEGHDTMSADGPRMRVVASLITNARET